MSSKQLYSYMDQEKIHPLLLCCICNKPLFDPVITDDSRRGCRSCLVGTSSSLTSIPLEWNFFDDLRVKCLQCGEINIPRSKLEGHQQIICKQAIVPCKAADLKCPWKAVREQLDKHMAECVFEPLRPELQ